MADPYRDDLAYIHDAGYGSLARSAAPVLLAALRSTGPERGLVIDLGSGTGILAAALVDAGYPVLGFDISAGMVALARQRVPQARFRRQSFVTAEFPACCGVASIGECFNYLFDRDNSDEALTQLFRRIYQALCPRGVFLSDVAEPGRMAGGQAKHCREEKDWAVLVTAEEDLRLRRLTRRITSFRKVGKLYRREHAVHELRLLVGTELAEQLRGIGFRVRLLRRYGNYRFPRGNVGLFARKPG